VDVLCVDRGRAGGPRQCRQYGRRPGRHRRRHVYHLVHLPHGDNERTAAGPRVRPLRLLHNCIGVQPARARISGRWGTYGVTFVFGILAINAHNTGAVSAETVAVWFFIPIVDCLRLMISRVRRGQAPSEGDRNHFHHRLQDVFGTTYSCIIYLGAVGASSLMATLVPKLSLVCLALLCAFYSVLMRPIAGEIRRAVRRSGARQLRASADGMVLLAQDRHPSR